MTYSTLLLFVFLSQGIPSSQELGSIDSDAADSRLSHSPSSVLAGVGLERVDHDSFVGAGRSYKAHFEPGSIEVTPVLGAAALRNFPLAFELVSIERGGEPIVEVEVPVVPVRDGDDVTYAHDGNVLERYELRPEGVYQSFRFEDPLTGIGDLVVRGRIGTELVPEPHGEGWRFVAPGVGGLEYGAVTGVDAVGRAFPGRLVIEGDFVELRLASVDVEAAVFPLLLDPLLGNAFTVVPGSGDDDHADVAYSTNSDRSLVVWNRRISSTDSDILGQQVHDGALVGPLRLIETGNALARLPSVAFVRDADRFLVAWQEQPSIFSDLDIAGRTLDSNGLLGPVISIANTSANERDPDVGGERRFTDDEALVTFEEDGAGIRVAEVRVRAGIEGVSPGAPLLSTSSDVRQPAISKVPDADGIFLVVWGQDEGTRTKIRGRAINRDTLILSTVAPISDAVGADDLSDSRPDVASTDDGFFVVYEELESTTSAKHDIEAVRWDYVGGLLVQEGPKSEIEFDSDDDERHPTVTFADDAVVVGYHDEETGSYDMSLELVDPYWPGPGREVLLEPGVAFPQSIRVASEWSGGGLSNDLLMVWDTQFAGATSDVRAIGYQVPSASISVGGGCGLAGELVTPAALDGSSGFRVHVRDSVPGAFAVLIVARLGINYTCGSCALIPDVLTSLVLEVATTDSRGQASFNVPIPFGIAPTSFIAQVAVTSGAGCQLFGGLELTDALTVRVSNP